MVTIALYLSLVLLAIVSIVATVFYLRDCARTVYQAPSNRGMFRFNDGLTIRHVDPIEVILSLDGHPEYNASIHAKQASMGNKEAIRIQCDAIKNAFGVVDFTTGDKPGLTVTEMTRLLCAFWEYVDLQKKSTEPIPIFVESTDATSTESVSPATNDLLPSGS